MFAFSYAETVATAESRFNEPAGRSYLATLGVGETQLAQLPLLGISGICNLLAAIKTAKYFDLGERDVIFTVFTDSMALYQSRLAELSAERGAYDERQAESGRIPESRIDESHQRVLALKRKAGLIS